MKKKAKGPLTLLEDALKKLNHRDMIPANSGFKYDEAIKICQAIQLKVSELKNEFDHLRFEFKKLTKKK